MLYEVTNKNEIKGILDYLKQDVANCIYIYTDIFTYGLSNPNMKIWAEKEGEKYNLIVMKYHDSFQLYTRSDKWDVEGVYQLICEFDVQMISGKTDMIKLLNEKYCGEKYDFSTGTIFRLSSVKNFKSEYTPEFAKISDVPEIAELLAQDPYYKDSYTVDELKAQLTERMETNMGRSCIIRIDGKIVAHVASFTEADGIAVSAGTIAHKDYRGKKLGLIVENYLNQYMNSNGYQWFGFILEKERVETFRKLGNKIVATYGKLVKKRGV